MCTVLIPVPGLGFTAQLYCSCGAAFTIAGYVKPAATVTGPNRQEFVCHRCGAVVTVGLTVTTGPAPAKE